MPSSCRMSRILRKNERGLQVISGITMAPAADAKRWHRPIYVVDRRINRKRTKARTPATIAAAMKSIFLLVTRDGPFRPTRRRPSKDLLPK